MDGRPNCGVSQLAPTQLSSSASLPSAHCTPPHLAFFLQSLFCIYLQPCNKNHVLLQLLHCLSSPPSPSSSSSSSCSSASSSSDGKHGGGVSDSVCCSVSFAQNWIFNQRGERAVTAAETPRPWLPLFCDTFLVFCDTFLFFFVTLFSFLSQSAVPWKCQ